MIRHVVWDWNGTLFADAEAMIASTIDAFHSLNLPPVTTERYQRLHTQPIDTFYDRLFGQTVPARLRQQLHAAFHEAYQRRRPDLGLTRARTKRCARLIKRACRNRCSPCIPTRR